MESSDQHQQEARFLDEPSANAILIYISGLFSDEQATAAIYDQPLAQDLAIQSFSGTLCL
jgi:hypothetical protein